MSKITTQFTTAKAMRDKKDSLFPCGHAQVGWREVKLDDVATLVKKSWKIGDEPLPYIGLEHIDEGKLRLNGFGNSDEIASNKYRFFKGDVLFGKLRPYFRKVIH